MRVRLVHCNTHHGRHSGAAAARERDECGATVAAEDVTVAADGLCMGTRRTRWDRTDRGADNHAGSHSHLSARALVSAAAARASAAAAECTAAVRRQRAVTHGVDEAADLRIDAPLLPPLLVQRAVCPSLFRDEAGAWRGRRRRSGGGWTAVAAAKASGDAAARAARDAYIGSRRTRCRCVRGRKSAVSSGRSTERQWRGSRDCKASQSCLRTFVQSFM